MKLSFRSIFGDLASLHHFLGYEKEGVFLVDLLLW